MPSGPRRCASFQHATSDEILAILGLAEVRPEHGRSSVVVRVARGLARCEPLVLTETVPLAELLGRIEAASYRIQSPSLRRPSVAGEPEHPDPLAADICERGRVVTTLLRFRGTAAVLHFDELCARFQFGRLENVVVLPSATSQTGHTPRRQEPDQLEVNHLTVGICHDECDHLSQWDIAVPLHGGGFITHT